MADQGAPIPMTLDSEPHECGSHLHGLYRREGAVVYWRFCPGPAGDNIVEHVEHQLDRGFADSDGVSFRFSWKVE